MSGGRYTLAAAARDCTAPAIAIMAVVAGACTLMTLGGSPWPPTLGIGLLFGVLAPACMVFLQWAERR
jgi:hypothetical protein